MKTNEVDKMTAKAAKEYLKELMERLDSLDCEDFFGSEGWRHFVMGED